MEISDGRRVFFGWFVVGGAFTILFLGFGIAHSFASFFDEFEADFEASRGDISLIFSIAGFLYFSLGAVSGPLSDRLGARPVVAFGIILIALGLFMASFAISLWQVYLTYGAAVGVGIGFSYVPVGGCVATLVCTSTGVCDGVGGCGYRCGHSGCTTFLPRTGGEIGLA